MTSLTAAECVAWVNRDSGGNAVVLADVTSGLALDGLDFRDMDPTTALRWVSRPLGDGARLLGVEGHGTSFTLIHLGADPLTGDISLASPCEEDLAPADQLGAIGIVSHSTDDGNAIAGQGDVASVTRFVVVPQSQAPEQPRRDRPPALPQSALPMDLTDSRFIGLLGESGAPLEAIWHLLWESAGVRWCLLNRDLDVEDVARIPYRHWLPASEFVPALRSIIDKGVGPLDLPVFVMTGPSQGHTIYLRAFDGEDVVYHDPWPGRSLLAKGNNRMNSQARPLSGRRLWRITSQELSGVGYAALVDPAVWLPFCGVEVDLTLDKVLASDFIGFFHFRETARDESADGQRTVIRLTPGHWGEHISVALTTDISDRVTRTELLVDRSWIDDPATTMFAGDLLSNYVQACVPDADSSEAALLAKGLAALPIGGLASALGAGPPHLLNQFRLVALTAMGTTALARAMLPCCTIRAYNVVADAGRKQLALVVSRARDEPGPLFEDQQTGLFMDEYRQFLWTYLRDDLNRLGWLPSDVGNVSLN